MDRRELLSHLSRALLIALAFSLICVPGMNSLSLYRGDEKVYIYAGWNMWETGNHLLPVHRGELFLERPLLYFWLEAMAFDVFGFSLFAARLPSLLAGALTVALVYWFTLGLYRDTRHAVYSALALASCYTTYVVSRVALMDMLMCLGTLMAACFYFHGAIVGRRTLNLVLASIGVGIAGMAKGHIGAFLAALPLATFSLLDFRSPQRVRLRELLAPWVWGPGVVLCGWYYVFILSCDRPVQDIIAADTTGETVRQAFLRYFTEVETSARLEGGWRGILTNLWFYPFAVLRVLFPWSLCVLIGFLAGRRWLAGDWRGRRRETAALLSMVVPTVGLFMFVVSQQERSRYLIPIAPAVAVLAGRWFCCRRDAGLGWRRVPFPVLAAAVLLLAVSFSFVVIVPAVRGRPVEDLCAFLRPRLRTEDRVWVTGMEPKFSVYAMALLGRETQYWEFSRKSRGPNSRKAFDAGLAGLAGAGSGSGSRTYLLTTRSAWESLARRHRVRFHPWRVARGLRETRLEDVRHLFVLWGWAAQADVPPGNLWELVLLECLPPGDGPASESSSHPSRPAVSSSGE